MKREPNWQKLFVDLFWLAWTEFVKPEDRQSFIEAFISKATDSETSLISAWSWNVHEPGVLISYDTEADVEKWHEVLLAIVRTVNGNDGGVRLTLAEAVTKSEIGNL